MDSPTLRRPAPPEGFSYDSADNSPAASAAPAAAAAPTLTRPAPPPGFSYEPAAATPAAAAAPETGDFMRGLKTSAHQLPQLAGGATAFGGDVLSRAGKALGGDGSVGDAVTNYGLNVYSKHEADTQQLSKPSDSFTHVLKHPSEVGSFLKYNAGYMGGQMLESAAAMGAGALAGSEAPVVGNFAGAATGLFARPFLERQIAKKAAELVAEKGLAREAAQAAAAKAVNKTLGAEAGAAAAGMALNEGQELGSIYHDARDQAQSEGRQLTGADLARVGASSVAAAGVDTLADRLNLGSALKGVHVAEDGAKSVLRRRVEAAAKEAGKDALRGGATEAAQTAIERYGAGQPIANAEGVQDIVDSTAAGAVGGGMAGVGAGLHVQKAAPRFANAAPGSLSDAANAVDEHTATPVAAAAPVAAPAAAAQPAPTPDTQNQAKPASANRVDPGLPPWADPTTGEVQAPTREQLVSALADHIVRQQQSTGDMRISTPAIAQAWGVPKSDLDRARNQATKLASDQVAAAERAAMQPATAPAEDQARVADAGTTASIPVMITQGMKRELRTLGHTDADIAKMTPQQAHDVLRGGEKLLQPARDITGDQSGPAVDQAIAEQQAAQEPTDGTGEPAAPKAAEAHQPDLKTWDNLAPGDQVTLYRGESAQNQADGEWWTTDKAKAERFGEVKSVTLPAEVVASHAARGHNGADEFVFPGARPSALAATKTAAENNQNDNQPASPPDAAAHTTAAARPALSEPTAAPAAPSAQTVLEQMSNGVRPLAALKGADEATVRAVGSALGHNFSPNAKYGTMVARLESTPAEAMSKRAGKALQAEPDGGALGATNNARPSEADSLAQQSEFTTKAPRTSLSKESQKLLEEARANPPAAPSELANRVQEMYRAAHAASHGHELKGRISTADMLARAIEQKDSESLRGMNIGDADSNPAMRKVFEQVTGVTLPPGKKASLQAIDAWAGLTPEDRARRESEKQAALAAKSQARHDEAVRRRAEGLAVNVKDSSAEINNARQYVDHMIGKGFARLHRQKEGAITRSYLAKADGRAVPLKDKTLREYAEVALRDRQKKAEPATTAAKAPGPGSLSNAARDAEGLRVKTPDGEVTGRTHVDQLVAQGFNRVESVRAGDKMVHKLVNAAGASQPIKARQLKYAQEATAKAATQAPEPTAYQKQQARDPNEVSTELEARAEALAPQIDALTDEQARAGLAAIGERKPKDLRDPKETLRRQHPDDVETALKAAKVEAAAAEAASSPHNDLPEPTQAQKEAGVYKMGHVWVQGLDISIESPRGSTRSGVGENGKPWSHVMSDHYGYIRGTEGADGDHVDVYVGPNPASEQVFVVDQLDQKTGGFDEHKVLLGFDSEAEAVKAYRSNFDPGWKVGPVHAMSMDEFKAWLKEGDTRKPAAEHVAVVAKAAPEEQGKLRNFGWDPVKLSEHSYDELNTLRAQVEQQHANPKDAKGHPVSKGQPTIHLYDKEGRRKLDALSWAVTYKLQESRAERDRVAAEIAAGAPPPKVPERVQRAPELPSLPAQPSAPAKAVQMTMAEWKAIHKDFKGTVNGQRTVMRDGRVAPVEIIKAEAQATPSTAIEQADAALNAARAGNGSIEDLRAAFERVRDNKEEVKAELSKLTKEQLLKRYRMRDDTKARMVTQAYRDTIAELTLSDSISYMIGGDANQAHLAAVQKLVDGLSQDKLDAYAAKHASYDAKVAEIRAGYDNPQTLEDYQRLAYSKGGEAKLSPEQRATFDKLRADARREQRETEAKRAAVVRQVDTGNTGMSLVETKHTKSGADLFVVRMDERVERDVYTALNQAAKRLGGHYSSYRGNGAVPGFTFSSRAAAEQFMAVREGNVDASAQQQARTEAKAENRAESLSEKAAALRERAQAKLSAERKDNTARRARMAEAAEADARKELAIADTMGRIAKAIEDGKAGLLQFVRARTQVELLDKTLRLAHWNHLRDQGVQWEKAKDMPPSAESITNAMLPQFWLTRGDAAVVAKRLREVRGGKALGDELAKKIDYGDEYGAAVQANPAKFMLGRSDGGSAIFETKRAAESALAASAGKVRGVVVKLPAGKAGKGNTWAVALSPELAIEHKLWAPDFDKKVQFSVAGARKVMDLLKLTDKGDPQVPYWWASHADERAAFARMGIETNYEMREALREYLALRQAPSGEDVVRKLERSLAGNKSVGVDFFPTPPAVVSRLVEQADIGPGMRVLEPSAGKGDIAEALRDAADGVTVDTVEMSHTLREILEAKGFDATPGDFLQVPAEPIYDRVVMNPPFGNDNGAEHVRHAYDMLKPGGRLVAVMGAGSRGKAEFDAWLDKVGGLSEPLPEGSFKSSFRPTGVGTQVVVIDKDETAAPHAASNPTRNAAAAERAPANGASEAAPMFSMDEKGQLIPGREAHTFTEARQAAVQFVGKPLENEHGAVAATVSNGTLAKMLSESAVRKSTSPADHMRAVANLDALYRIGMLDETAVDKRGEPTIAAIHRVVAPMVGEKGEVLAVKMTVKETTHPGQPNPLYSVETLEVQPVEEVKPARNAPQSGIERAPGQDRNAPQAGFGADVTRMLGDFKKHLFRLTNGMDPEASVSSSAQVEHAAQVRKVAESAMASWKGDDVPSLRVVPTPEQLPAIAKRGADGSPDASYKRAAGMYDGHTIYIVASAHKTDQAGVRRILTTMAHEGVGHYGIDRIVQRELGADAWEQIESSIDRLRTDKSAGSEAMRSVLDSVQSRYGAASRTTFARETLAVMAERGVRNGLLDRVVTALRRWLRKVLPSLKLSEQEFRQLLVRSKEYLERGPSYAERVHAAQAVAFQKVFHGTPHTVDKFSLHKIGTGEGAQAYGWGMYFASDKAIADHYRRGLSTRDFVNKARDAYDEYYSPDEAIHELRNIEGLSEPQKELLDALKADGWLGFDYPHQAISAALREPDAFELSPATEAALAKQGNLYHVEVPEDHDLLDWDKPISEQPEKVRSAMEAILADPRIDQGTREEWGHAAPQVRNGKRFYNLIAGADGVYGGAKGASALLNEYGIPGLRYLDGTSRAKGEGSANYVIWDEGAMGAPEAAMSLDPSSDQTQTPAFKRWFGESRVVDGSGRPLPVYHGTASDFDAFDPARSGSATAHMTATLGTFFAEDRSKAEHYAENASGGVPAEERVVDAFLSISKPYEMGLDQFMAIDSQAESTALREKLQREGFDGIHLKDIGQWIAFRPEQIKSASENNGDFNPSDKRINFSLDDRGEQIDPTQPAKPFSRAAASMNALQEGAPKVQASLLQSAKGWLTGKARDFEPAALGALQLRHVLELMEDSKLFPAAKQYAAQHQRMDADRTAQIDRGSELTKQWQSWAYEKGPAGWAGKLKPEAKNLARFIHDVTQQGIDPTDAYKKLLMQDSRGEHMPWTKDLIKERIKALREQMRGRPGDDKAPMLEEIKFLRSLPSREKARESKYPELVARWNALPEKAKNIFRMARDRYQELSDLTERALLDRVDALSVPETYKRSLADRIRFQFEANRVEGVYFPLSRFGDYWVSGTQADGQSVFGMFESYHEAEKAITRLKAAGVEIEAQGLKDSDYKAKNAPSGTFVSDIIGLLQKSGAPEKVQDEVYQLFLKTLPELSMRKHGIHRKNVAGFSDDALRAFAKNNFHSAHQIARLAHGFQMSAAMEAMETAFENRRNAGKLGGNTDMPLAEAVHGDALLGELKKRHDWIMSPKDSQMANVATSVGYLYYMSASPAAALVNLTQGAQVTLPVLGARHGWPKAMAALGSATKDAMRTFGNIQRVLKTDEERKAFQVLEAQGTFQRTATHTLAGIAEGNKLTSNPTWAKVMNAMGYLFHKAEVINREAAGVAAFRLARGEGQTFEQSVRYADEIVNGTHFDYSNANRARYMQGNVPKILFQFKNYSVGMSWVLYRNLYKAMKGETPEVRRLARRTLTGVLGMTGLFAGVMGLPIINLLRYSANAAHAVGGDDDEPWDFNTEFRSWLAEHLGQDVANWVADGAVNQVTGANISSRVSLSDLWFRDPDRELEGKDAYYNYLDAIAGPLGGLAKNLFVGSQMIGEGQTERGIETILPKFVKDAMKATRYASQGSNTLRGDPIVPDVSSSQVMLQALGFQPTGLAEQQRLNNSLMNYQHAIQDRRQTLMNAFAMAQMGGDEDGRSSALTQIRDFNAKYPEIAIRMSNLHESLRTRAQRSAQAENGVMLNKKLAGRVRQEVGAMADG